MDKRVEILDLPEETRRLVSECEVTGSRTMFDRNGRTAAILISYDEYTALSETIDISNDSVLRAELEKAEQEMRKNALMLPEDLFEL